MSDTPKPQRRLRRRSAAHRLALAASLRGNQNAAKTPSAKSRRRPVTLRLLPALLEGLQEIATARGCSATRAGELLLEEGILRAQSRTGSDSEK